MKKFLSILLILSMMFSFASCKGKGDKLQDQGKVPENKSNPLLVAKNTEGKTKLTFACFTLMNHIEDRIIKFNNTNSKYYIEVKDYSQYNTEKDFSAGNTKLNTEIIGGNTPDIIELGQVPADSYISKGLFEDLNNFLSKDEKLKKDSLVPSAYNALSTGNHLYRIGPSFTVTSLYGRASKIGNRDRWNVTDLQKFLRDNKQVKAPFINMPAADVLRSLTMYSMDQFVDANNRKCSFNSQEFITLLETIKEFSGEANVDYKEASDELLANRGLLATMYFSNVKNIVDSYNKLNGDINFIGYPTKNGSGNVDDFQFTFGIFAASKNKEGAWEFLKSFFEEDYQNDLAEIEIPVLKSAYDKALNSSDAKKEYKDLYNKVINSINKISTFDGTLMKIIEEEATPFFEGQHSAKEAADAIQSKASIYLSENK